MTMREELLGSTEVQYATVTDPRGRVWTIRDMDELEKSNHDLNALDRKNGGVDYSKLVDAKLKFIAACLVDPETKEQLLAGDDWKQLRKVRSQITSCIYSACLKHSGYEKSEVEDLVGNSD